MTTPPPVLYQDDRLVILNKPAGLPSHAGPRGGSSAEDWFAALSRRRDGPWLAHRLDTDTAGCLTIALRKRVLLDLQALFASGQAEKLYWAIVQGCPPDATGRLDRPLRKITSKAGWRMVADKAGLSAVTEWTVLGAGGGRSWLALRPRTGRTHQLRVHCALLGCPIVGDTVYGDGGAMLHLTAHQLRLPLDPVAAAIAPPPPHMHAALAALGWQPAATPL